MSDWENELDNDTEQTSTPTNTVNSNQTPSTAPQTLVPKEEEELVKLKKEPSIVLVKDTSKPAEDDYEAIYQEKNKRRLEEKKQFIISLDGLTEEQKAEKLQELDRLHDAAALVDEEEVRQNEKIADFDYSKHALEKEKDFVDLATKVAAKLKIQKKHPHFLAFLKRLNTVIAKEFSTELKSELLGNITLIKNKKKTEKGKAVTKEKEKDTKVSKIGKRMEMDLEVEVNPDYKPRNHVLYDDFM